MKKIMLGFIAATLLATTPALAAPVPGVAVSGGSQMSYTDTEGFSFSVSQARNITALGVYDSGVAGLTDSHQVGLWDTSGTLLASVTVPAGSGATLQGGFRYVNLVSPYALNAGQTYVVGAFMSASDLTLAGAAVTPANGVTFIDGLYSPAQSFTRPTATQQASFGANFLLATPEPGTWVLMIGGFGAVGATLRRRRRAPVGLAPAGA